MPTVVFSEDFLCGFPRGNWEHLLEEFSFLIIFYPLSLT